MRKIAQFCLVAFFLIALTVNADSTIRPTILHRIPLKWYQHGDLMQITTNEAYAWAGPNNQVVKYPAGIDIRYISGVNRTLEIITDCGWNRILSIETNWDEDPVKNSVHAFGECGLDDGQFRFPVGVQIGGYAGVFDADIDYVYVIDALNRRIVRLQYDMLNGQLVWNSAFGQENLVGPRGIVYIDNNTENRNDDEILVTDMLASKIVRFTAVGNYIGSYGVPGSGMGQILTPYGITKSVNNGESQNIYITDIRNVKICCYEWTPEGVEFQNEICFSDNPQGKLMGITTDDQGIVYVADRIKNRLLKLSPELRLIAEISEATAGPDYAFYKPEAILFNDGALVVINKFCQSAGFECFQQQYADTMKWDEEWAGLNISLKSDLLVQCGQTLKLGSGTHISVAVHGDDKNLGKDPNRVEILVEGTLICNGTQQDSVLIYSDGSPPKKGDWYGIRVTEPCGLVNMQYTSVRNAENAIDFYDGTNNTNYIYGYIYHSQLEKNATAGIYSLNSILDLENSLLSDNNIYGLYCGKTKADVYSDGFIGNGSYGIYVDRENYVGDSVRIVSSVIDGQSVTQYNGLYLKHSAARVEGCHIRNCEKDAGMLVSGYSPKIRLDTLTTKIGIDCANSASPTLRYCRITPSNVQVGVNARSGSFPDLGLGSSDKGNNSIHPTMATGGFRVVNSNILTSISAKYNWWGTSSPIPSMFSGLVTYDPWLYGEPPPPPKVSTPEELPRDFFVSNNYPNPFNPSTRINYSIPSGGILQITIYNILGQQVKSLYDGRVNAGFYQLSWDGTDNQGMQVGSGIYLINFRFNDSIETRKVVLLR